MAQSGSFDVLRMRSFAQSMGNKIYNHFLFLTNFSFPRENNIGTNRGNNLLLNCLKHRFPNIFQQAQLTFANELLSRQLENTEGSNDTQCISQLMSYVSENDGSYPLAIGEDYSEEQRNEMAVFLMRRHLLDFKSSHCTPLPGEYFQLPWAIPSDTDDFVFT